MREISILRNTVQEYEWGSLSAIPELLGQPASTRPMAELWMGAHPRSPSLVEYEGGWVPLPGLIERFPEDILGKETAKKYRERLPYLFKVLAAAKPLSIQAHPDREQAARGFAEENRRGITLDSPMRNYRDANPKPECICALTFFRALSGFREIGEMLSLMEEVCLPGLQKELADLRDRQDGEGLKSFFTILMTLDGRRKEGVIDEAVRRAGAAGERDEAFGWMVRLHREFPGDIGVLAPLLLNLVCLRPGEAMFLPAGRLHSYLDGVGMELMANSDNVLRGGLTSKHVDLPELLRILVFKGERVLPLLPGAGGKPERVYPTPAEEFALSVITVEEGAAGADLLARSAEILMCTEGKATLVESGGGRVTEVGRGCSVLVPAAVGGYRVEGAAILYKASVPVQQMT